MSQDDAFDVAARVKHPPSLVKPRLIGAVPLELVPTKENKRRLVFVGDIHGMINELDELLEKIGFDVARDHLVALGDMVNKGTNTSAVIDRLMHLGASAVRGNHEEHVLNAWVEEKAGSSWFRPKEPAKHRDTARSLREEQLDWLSKLPIILTTDPLPIYAVHGGLVPGVQLQHQQPWAVMNMRTLLMPPKKKHGKRDDDAASDESPLEKASDDADSQTDEEDRDENAPHIDYSSAVPIEGRDGIKWTKAWNTHQKRLFKIRRRTVMYGHDAKRGYKEGKYTFGLDSNCVGGGALTALVVEATKDSFKHKTIQVPCKTRDEDDA
ncbi:Bis(5'-nucleosyl)-tetraphosphatase, symmetrical [Paramyrothecium foliicola]|nr:Bis(5'-nucleosyl)-tetraphosphatase, symmetrical [Paramyrothecium foliicola]